MENTREFTNLTCRACCLSRKPPSNESYLWGWPFRGVWCSPGFPKGPYVGKWGFLTPQFWVTMKSCISIHFQVTLLCLELASTSSTWESQESRNAYDEWEKPLPSGFPGELSCYGIVCGGGGPGSHGSLHVTHTIIWAKQQRGDTAWLSLLNDVIYAET